MSEAALTLPRMAHHFTPMQLVTEFPPGHWIMKDRGHTIAIIRLLECGPRKERLYRAVTAHPDPEQRALLGFFPNLPLAAHIVWHTWSTKRTVA